MITEIKGIHSIHHLVALDDFEYVEAGLLICRYCKETVNSGLINVTNHIESCEAHPVFVQTGFDWKKWEAIGEEMTYGEYLKRINSSA